MPKHAMRLAKKASDGGCCFVGLILLFLAQAAIGAQQPVLQKNRVIVRLAAVASADDVDDFCEEQASHGRPCFSVYKLVFKGCVLEMDEFEREALTNHPLVRSIHNNDAVHTHQRKQIQPQSNKKSAPSAVSPPLLTVEVQTQAAWNLNRVSHSSLPIGSDYNYTSDGTGVNVYILDTGIRSDHEQFRYSKEDRARGLMGSRVVSGFSTFGDNSTEDCFGHGTHVAGTVGGLTFGIAKNVTLYAVRAIDCTGTSSAENVISALEWVAANRVLPAIASLSLGSAFSNQLLDAALQAVIDLGVVGVVAAGNFNTDACDLSPGRIPESITVAATDVSDSRWVTQNSNSGSNYGQCVDLFAPGVAITSAFIESPTATISATGTSMACPHVSGVVAQYLQRNPEASPAQVQSFITRSAAKKKVQGGLEDRGTPNLLLQTDLPVTINGSITPLKLKPVTMYLGRPRTETQVVTIGNIGSTNLTYMAGVTSQEALWVNTVYTGDTIQGKGETQVNVVFDSQGLIEQAIYDTQVLVEINEHPFAKAYPSRLMLFCPDMADAIGGPAPHTADLKITYLRDGPSADKNWTMRAAKQCDNCILIEATVRFSHPVAELLTSSLTVNNRADAVLSVKSEGSRGKLCSDFVIQALVPFQPFEETNTTVCIEINGSLVPDVAGNGFPKIKTCNVAQHRPRGTILSALPFSAYAGYPVTRDAVQVLVVAFTKPVTGVNASSFNFTGPASVQTLGLRADPSRNIFTMQFETPASYLGTIKVGLQDGSEIVDAFNQTSFPVLPFTSKRLSNDDYDFGSAAFFTGVTAGKKTVPPTK